MPWLIALMLVSVSREPLCYSDDWGVVINAGATTCQGVVRSIADTTDPGWRENPFSHWHGLLADAEDGEMSIATNAAYVYDRPNRQNKREACTRAWITCLVIVRDRMPNERLRHRQRR